jgi:NADH:ubiquinone reductase (H+-translocating)
MLLQQPSRTALRRFTNLNCQVHRFPAHPPRVPIVRIPHRAFRPATSSEPSILRALTRDTRPQWQKNTYFLSRSLTTKPLPGQKSRFVRFCYRGLAFVGFFVLSCGIIVAGLFIYDATTYREDLSISDIPVSEYALNPRRGGPKNLPIAEHFVDDDDDPGKRDQKHKPKLVILGSGWGSVALLKQLNPDDYHVTVVSTSNTFLFTPMLPSATVGTLELRSLVEPVRGIVARVKGHFFKGKAEDVDFSNRLVEVSAPGPDGETTHWYLPYDKLVIGVGRFQVVRLGRMHTHSSRLYNNCTWRIRSRTLPFPERHQRRSTHSKLSDSKPGNCMLTDNHG